MPNDKITNAEKLQSELAKFIKDNYFDYTPMRRYLRTLLIGSMMDDGVIAKQVTTEQIAETYLFFDGVAELLQEHFPPEKE